QVQHLERQEAIGRLSGGIAHDFNNILTPIIGYTEIVRSKLPKDGNEANSLERVLEAAHRARNLIARILQFSRPSRQIKRPVRMDEVTKEVLTLMRSTFSRTIEIIEEIDPEIGLVNADVTEIYTALMNLCVNASHAMPDGGELRVGLKEIELDGHQTPGGAPVTGSYVRLVLTDTGTGMPAAVMAKIYEPFFTTKAEGQGTGLGLPTVREIVEKHGGFIEVSSTQGVGTEFRLFFPLYKQEVEESIPARPMSTEGDESILFVEEQASIRGMGRMLLEEMGYQVTLAKDSREALDIFQTGGTKFDLVIAGQSSPHMTGNRLAEELKRISPDFPFILTAATPDPEEEEKFQDGVVNYVLPKPYSRDSLGQAVKKVLHRDG
ncbi:MAG: ATP-binding protein, partial [bacterium]